MLKKHSLLVSHLDDFHPPNNIITEVSLSSQSSRVLYADDALLYRPISHPDNFLAVQSGINKIKVWSDEHLLQLNPTKCKYMVLSKTRSQH